MNMWNGITTIVLTREQHCEFSRELFAKGYTIHHKAKHTRHYRIGTDSQMIASFAEPYNGKFGKGVKLIVPQRNTQYDVVVYYIKKESNQLDRKE